jgi:hypothetical protein
MADIARGETFTTQIPDAASLHALVDDATILPAFITAKSVSTPDSADAFIFAKNGSLLQCTLAGLISALPSDGAASVASLRQLGTTATTAAAGNDARFPSSILGIRKANSTAPDTVATSHDLTLPYKDVSTATTIDWSQGSFFYANLTGNVTYALTGFIIGQEITVLVNLNGHTVSFTPAVMTTVGSGTTWAYVKLSCPPPGIVGYRVSI